MKHIKMIALLYLFFHHVVSTNAEGFAAGTFVKVPDGYEKIEHIRVGDQVLCFDTNKQCIASTVVSVSKRIIDSYVCIGIANENMCVACDQQLYDENSDSWIIAESLQSGDILAGHIIVAEVINEPIDIYVLSVAQHHNFFVTMQDVCVHNFFPLVVGISVAFGSGALELAGFSVGLAGLGAFLGYKWHKKSEQEHAIVISPVMLDIIEKSDEIYNLDDAQAPGMPTEKDGFYPPKKWDGKKKRNPQGGGFGWPDKKGHIWIPTGPKAHRGPHWDVQDPKTGRHRNVLPGGRVC